MQLSLRRPDGVCDASSGRIGGKKRFFIGLYPNKSAKAINTGIVMIDNTLEKPLALEAGSAHKMVLNMISTGVMIKLGRVYENYMIYIKPVNIKLKKRMIRIISELAGYTPEKAEQMLEENNWKIDEALKNQ